MNIRRILPSEAEVFYALRLRGLKEAPEAFGSTYEEEASWSADEIRERFPSASDNFVLGAFGASGELVGAVGFYREKRTKVRHKGIVWGMYVLPDARGRGVGRALVAALIAEARLIDGLEQINLDVVTTCEPALRLYLSLGFRVWGAETRALKHHGKHHDLEHMVLLLNSEENSAGV